MAEAKKQRELSALEKKLNNWAAVLISIKFTEKLFFVDHMRTMVKAGLSLIDTLDILSKEMENKKFQKIIQEIKLSVEKGTALSEVLAGHPKVFPSIYVKMIASGEVSGKLEESLEQITTQMKRSRELTSSIRGALIYPAVILVAMTAVGVLMATVILPKMLALFKDFDAELPLATRILIVTIDFLSNPIYLTSTILSVSAIMVVFIYLLRRSPDFKHTIHKFNLHIPIVGSVIKQINLAKFSLTLSSCSNVLYQKALHDTAERIKSGEPLSDILHQHKDIFPPMVTEMIMVGERSGEVDHLLAELSEYYSREVDKTMKNFSTIIEPIIILVMGAAVAGIAVAVVMPMFSLVQNF
jgi:type IV pilus assembly protein PilC